MPDEKDSVSEGRRENDFRIEKLEDKVENLNTTVGGMCEDIGDIKVKIFNGFGTSIKNTETNVNRIDKENKDEHKALTAKIDKMMWLMITVSFLVVVKGAIEFFII